jgi:sporulation-control protein spo0M
MADADFDVHVTSKRKRIAAGDEATLEVEVTVPKAHDTVELVWEVGWRASGRRTNTVVVASGKHPIGRMAPGKKEELTMPFTIPREGPVTYGGTLLTVEWFVKVSLDIPWAIDPAATFGFEVVPRSVKVTKRA